MPVGLTPRQRPALALSPALTVSLKTPQNHHKSALQCMDDKAPCVNNATCLTFSNGTEYCRLISFPQSWSLRCRFGSGRNHDDKSFFVHCTGAAAAVEWNACEENGVKAFFAEST
ncbi:hypothetical protein EYF80_035960 [Liparis tanakae]|uniref:Uncharacterized protein n=1 Tax=Liparis tanakae TaxID=230148 RepID=A0A4Z2GKL1_9TELE|nr:hypothetical protein EYF80_035960 [Liparis tanakae]